MMGEDSGHPSLHNLEFKLGSDVPKEHHGLLASIHNHFWGWIYPATADDMGRRLSSGMPILVAYDSRQSSDFIPGEDISRYDRIPVVLLEILLSKLGGDLEKFKGMVYKDVTNNGLFMTPPKNPDTALMLDLTIIPSRKGKGGGEVSRAISYGNSLLDGYVPDAPFDLGNINDKVTGTPDIPGIVRMHIGFGAHDSGIYVPDFRNPLINGRSPSEVDSGKVDPRMYNVRMMRYPRQGEQSQNSSFPSLSRTG